MKISLPFLEASGSAHLEGNLGCALQQRLWVISVLVAHEQCCEKPYLKSTKCLGKCGNSLATLPLLGSLMSCVRQHK